MVLHWMFYLAALFASLLFHTYYTGWFSWYLLLLLLVMPVFSFLCSLPAMRALRLRAGSPCRCKLHEQSQIVFWNEAGGFLPTPLYRFSLTRTDEMSGEQAVLRLHLSANARSAVQIPTNHCGALRYTLSKGRVYDYLGLFALPIHLPEIGLCEVWPEAREPSHTPNLSQFQSRSFRPKYGGGFSELHELREYRPGDQMRDVHWKLSAKADDLIVREPMEPNRGQAVVSLDLAGTRQELDSTLAILLWISGWLIGREVTFDVCWIDPVRFEAQSRTVTEQSDLTALVQQLLGTRLSENTPSIASRPFPRAEWRYHIRQDSEEVAAE